jgi:hypothetical protein
MFQHTPNVSSDQTIPFDDVRASMLVQEFHTLIDREDVYSIMNFGTVAFVDEPTTSAYQKLTLTECIADAHAKGKKNIVVLNGSNDSEGKEGTTFTSSNWVEECANNYSEHPLYSDMKFHCFGLSPHSTADMKAAWMEEHGNQHTQTFIVALSASDRQTILSILGSKCDKVILNEGAGGSLSEMYQLYLGNKGMFTDNYNTLVVNNSSYLLNRVIPNALNSNDSVFSHDTLTTLSQHLQTIYAKV